MGRALLKHRLTGALSFSKQDSEDILFTDTVFSPELAKEEMAWRNVRERFL